VTEAKNYEKGVVRVGIPKRHIRLYSTCDPYYKGLHTIFLTQT